MFRRTESERERALLRLISDQQGLIRDLADRLAAISGHPMMPPPLTPIEAYEDEEPTYSALDGIPPTMHGLELGE
jgi:hypothetical protein